jgi:hypothetical protein
MAAGAEQRRQEPLLAWLEPSTTSISAPSTSDPGQLQKRHTPPSLNLHAIA